MYLQLLLLDIDITIDNLAVAFLYLPKYEYIYSILHSQSSAIMDGLSGKPHHQMLYK